MCSQNIENAILEPQRLNPFPFPPPESLAGSNRWHSKCALHTKFSKHGQNWKSWLRPCLPDFSIGQHRVLKTSTLNNLIVNCTIKYPSSTQTHKITTK